MENSQQQSESHTIDVREGDTEELEGLVNTREHPRTPRHAVISIPGGQTCIGRHAGGSPPNEIVGQTNRSHQGEVRMESNQSERQPMEVTLLKAAREGNIVELKRLLQEEENQAQPRQEEGNQAPPRISRLLQGVTSDWDGVLHIAARLGHVDLVLAISVRAGLVVDVAAKNRRGETPLHRAAATGNVDMIDLLIPMAGDHAKQMELLSERKCNGETCLHEAVRCGNKEAVERLIAADVRVRRDGCRALVQIEDKEGVSPLYLATTLRELKIVQFLTKEQQRDNILYPAASYAGPGNETALHAAVLLSKELSEHLVQWKKELIENADLYGNTPLHLLASAGGASIAELLLKTDLRAGYREDAEGSLPIHVAAANGRLEIIDVLLEHCPNCDCSSNMFGQTIHHIAVQKSRENVVSYVCSGQTFLGILTRGIQMGIWPSIWQYCKEISLLEGCIRATPEPTE